VGLAGLILSVGVALVALVGPFVAPYAPDALGAAPAQSPSRDHLLGTDALGRDVLSRLLSGGREILAVATVATLIAFLVGCAVGIAAALYRGRIDTVVSRILDVLISLPPLLVVLVILAGFGTGVPVVLAALGLVFAPRIARVVRGAALGVATQDYIQSAIARGERPLALITREMAPNIAPQLLVELALRFTYAILFIAALSFLGLGAQPPSSDWGLAAAENRIIITVNPFASLAPAVMICLLSVGISLIADSVTHYLGIATAPLRG
jgi:peptide/nickel transport system permease protein